MTISFLRKCSFSSKSSKEPFQSLWKCHHHQHHRSVIISPEMTIALMRSVFAFLFSNPSLLETWVCSSFQVTTNWPGLDFVLKENLKTKNMENYQYSAKKNKNIYSHRLLSSTWSCNPGFWPPGKTWRSFFLTFSCLFKVFLKVLENYNLRWTDQMIKSSSSSLRWFPRPTLPVNI